MAEWSNLGKVVYKRTYARKDSGKLETWEETVDRVIAGNLKNQDPKTLLPNEEERLKYYLLNRKAGPAGRGWWFSGAPAHNRIGGSALTNPLHVDTKVMTLEKGWVKLSDLEEGEWVKVLSNEKLYGRDNLKSANPIWADAVVSKTEKHNCLKITYEDKSKNCFSVISSLNHRWFRRKNTKSEWERVCTEELRVGDTLPKTTLPKNYNLSKQGAQHGFFFGDGSRTHGELWQFTDENIDVLEELFGSVELDEKLKKAVVRGLPSIAWSKIPQGAYYEDRKYVYGFLAGYFAADGHLRKTDGQMRLHSSKLEELTQIKNLFEYVGVATGDIYLDSSSSNFSEDRKLYCLNITKHDVCKNFFLKDSHIKIYDEVISNKKRAATLKIINIEKIEGLQEVKCLTVPKYEQFVIEGFCLTSNCWFLTADQYKNFVIAQDLLMLGGGVGLSVEHRFVTHLPKVKKDVFIFNKDTRDADFIVPDSREGWCELTRRVLQSYLEDGKSFSYSTKCLRGHGEVIKGFGGKASGPQPLKDFITNLCALLENRAGKHIRPIDAADIICLIGQMVVAGNVRRSALLILGDPWDKEYLKSKRWDLGPIPPHRAMANFSVVIDDVEDLHKSFWDTYKQGEPFGICNRKNMQKYGRMGERKKDSAIGLNPCVTGDTEVLTDKGYFQIQDLVGTEVNIWNGFEFSAVKPSITGHNRKILNIKFSDGRELKCTPNHKFHLSRGYHGQTEIVEALDLSIGDKLIKHEFPVIKEGVEYDKDKMYSQGFYSADGTKNSNNINLYGDKRKLAKYLLGKLGSAVQENQFGTERQIFTLSFRPKEKNYVPLEANLESRLAWLAGVLDGDGCELKEGGFQLSSIDYNFLLDVQKLLSISGVNSKIVKGMEEAYRDLPDGKGGYSKFLCKESNRICVGALQVKILKDLGLNTKRLSFEKSPNRDASRFNQVISIKDLGEVDTVYCFTELKRNLGCFNGIVTGQCAEATLENYEPCVAGNTNLIHKNGIIQIEDAVGKDLEIWNGTEWCKVSPYKTGDQVDLYRVSFSDGTYLDATENHKFLVKNRFQKEFKEYKTIELSKILSESKYPCFTPRTKVEGAIGKSDKNTYEYGIFLGDGYLDRQTIKLKLIKDKQNIVVNNTYRSKLCYTDRYDTGCFVYTLNHLSLNYCRALKNKKEGLPDYFMQLDKESSLNFIAGWLDADGANQANGVRLYGLEKKLRDAQLILTRFGISSSINLMSKKGTKTNYGTRNYDMYYLQIHDASSIPTQRLGKHKSSVPRTKGLNKIIKKVEKLPGKHKSFCLTEPKNNTCLFNNVLTKQCNLQEIWLPNLKDESEFIEAASLMHRWGKRVTCEPYHNPENDEVVKRNRRVGTGITGCLQALHLFNKNVLDKAYDAIQKENEKYSRKLGIPKSIRTTVVKPSGTLSLVGDTTPGIHPSYSRYYIRRVRFSSNDPLIPVLRDAGHPIEPVKKFDGTLDHNTLVVDFFCETPDGTPVADEDFDTWQQLDTLLLAQKHWADQAVSVTVYYTKGDLPKLKEWLANNLKYLKSISFLLHSDHGFEQAPLEAISKEQYEKSIIKLKEIHVDEITGEDLNLEDCEGGACPIK